MKSRQTTDLTSTTQYTAAEKHQMHCKIVFTCAVKLCLPAKASVTNKVFVTGFLTVKL